MAEHPESFKQAKRIKQYVRDIVRNLKLADSWNYELAAMLSQLDYAILPQELLEKLGSEQQMNNIIRMRLLAAKESGIISGTFKVFQVAEGFN